MSRGSRPYGWYTADDPGAYEAACLEAVKRALRDSPTTRRGLPIVIHDLRLEGEYPNTEIVVDVARAGCREPLRWRLHGDEFGETASGYQDWPQSVADQIFIQVLEFGP